MGLEEYPEEKHIEPSEFNSCDKSESDLDTDKARICSDPHESKVYCKHCGNWVTHEEWEEEAELGDIMTGTEN